MRIKGRLWILLALAAFALLVSSTPVFRDSHSKSSPTQVFAQILRESYAGWTGFHTCVTTHTPNLDLCFAELRKGSLYRVLELNIDTSRANPVVTEAQQHSPHPRVPIPFSAPEGIGTVNSSDYAWQFVMQHVDPKALPVTLLAADDSVAAFPPRMFLFHCTGVPTKVTCRNSFGDYVTYTPTKK